MWFESSYTPLFNYTKDLLHSTVTIYLNLYSQRKQECLGKRIATYDCTYLLWRVWFVNRRSEIYTSLPWLPGFHGYDRAWVVIRTSHLVYTEIIRKSDLRQYRQMAAVSQNCSNLGIDSKSVDMSIHVGHLESKERLRIQPAQLFNFSWWVMRCVQ